MSGTQRDIPYLEEKFQTGDIPTQQDFYDLFASFVHYLQVKQASGSSTSDVMSQKAISDLFTALKDGVPSAGDTLNKLYNLITAMGRPRGGFDASSGNVPTPTADNEAGDFWRITVAGTIGTMVLKAGDVLIASIDDAAVAADFYAIQANVDQSSETVLGLVQLITQVIAEDAATNGTVGNINHTSAVTGRGVRWFWDKVKTLATVFTSSFKAKQVAGDYGVLTDAATISWDANVVGNIGQVTLGGNRTLGAITNPLVGAVYILRVVQDVTGGRTLSFNVAYTFPNNISPVLNSAASAVTVFQFFYDGSNFRYLLPNGAQRVTDLYINSQIESGKKVLGYIDTDGKFTKMSWAELNTTTRTLTKKGIDNLMTTILEEWKNSDDAFVMQILNGLRVKFGGSSAIWEVDDAVASGNAEIAMVDNVAIGLRFRNKNGDEMLVARTTTGSLAWVFREPVEYDFKQGFKKIHVQVFTTIETLTASLWTNLASIALSAGEAATINVNHLHAYAPDNSNAFAYGNMQGYARRATGGTVSGTNPSYTIQGDGITGVNWRINPNDTDKRLDIDFQNNSGTGLAWRIALDFTYIKRSLPS